MVSSRRVKLDSESLQNQSFSQTTANEDDVACEFCLHKGVVRCSIYDIIVYGRMLLGEIKKHMARSVKLNLFNACILC